MGVISMVLLVALTSALWFGARTGGVVTVAFVMLGHVTLALALWAVLVQRLTGIRLTSQWAAVRTVVFSCLVAWLTAWAVGQASEGAGAVPALSFSLVAGAAVYVAAVRILEPSLLGEGIRRTAHALRGASADRVARDGGREAAG
jgi:hypothetical protein